MKVGEKPIPIEAIAGRYGVALDPQRAQRAAASRSQKSCFVIAIQPDEDPYGASSPIWTRCLASAGHEVREVDVHRADILDQLRGCDGLMWRHANDSNDRLIACRLLPVVEKELGLAVFPDRATSWHYDDKIGQRYLLEAAGIPIPKTWVWYDAALAKEWAREAHYPLVFKLWNGAASMNVTLVRSVPEAEGWIDRLFGLGINVLGEPLRRKWRVGRHRLWAALDLLLRGILPERPKPDEHFWELHKNYVLFQEFLSGNPFDTRVTIIGNRAFGFRRFNRDNDFRASGSGRIDYDRAGVASDFVELAFEVARKLGTQSCAIDGLRRGTAPVVGEITYTYASKAVHECPGHWELVDGRLEWREGHLWSEEAQVADFLERLRAIHAARERGD